MKILLINVISMICFGFIEFIFMHNVQMTILLEKNQLYWGF